MRTLPRDLHRPDQPAPEARNAPEAEPALPELGPRSHDRDVGGNLRSSNLSFEKGNLENLFVIDGAMPEVTILAEQFAVVRSDRDPGVLRHPVEQLLHYSVEILDRVDLAGAEPFQLRVVEKLSSFWQLASDNMIVQMFEHTMYATDARPIFGRFIRQGIRIVRLAYVQKVERWAVLGKLHVPHHGPHIVMLGHKPERIESVVQDRLGIKHRQGNHRVGPITKAFLQECGEIQFGDQRLELNAFYSKSLRILQKIPFVIVGRKHMLWTGMGQ